MTRRSLTVALVAAGLSWQPLAAQIASRLTVAAGATGVRLQSRSATGLLAELTGVALGGEGGLSVGPVALELAYWQGRLDPAAGGPPPRDMIDGRALLGVRAGGLAVKGGAEARSHVTTAGTERWVFWQLRVRAERVLVEPTVRGHVEVWRSLATEVNAAQPVDRGQGGEVGLTLRRALGPLWVRVTYGIDDARLTGSARRETFEALALSVGLGGR